MRFEIEGDTPAILNALESYKEAFNKEYVTQIKAAKEKLKVLGMPKATEALPEELDLFFWEEDGKVIIRIPIYTPLIIKALKRDKKLGENFKKFLETQGVHVKCVKHTGD